MTAKRNQGVYTELNPDGIIVEFKSYLENPIGYTSDELLGENWFDIFFPIDAGVDSPKSLKDILTGDKSWTHLTKMKSKIGDTRYIEWRFQGTYGSNHELLSIVGMGQEASGSAKRNYELHRSLFKLQERNRVVTCLYRIAQTAVDETHPFEIALQNIVDLIPQGFECPKKMAAGIQLGQATYKTPGFDLSLDRLGKEIVVKGTARGRVEVGSLYKGEAYLLNKAKYSLEEGKLIESAARKIAYIIERKEADEKKQQLEDQLRHADRLATIGQLAAGIAHELNNPLGDILGFAQLSSKHPDLPEQIYQDQVKIVKSTLYAREVIKKILLFSRQSLPYEGQANLNDLIEDWVDFFEFRCKQNDIEIILAMDPELPSITGDPSQLNQVLINLVVNAIHAMPNGGTLTIKTGIEHNTITLQVSDTGSGIAEDIKDKIFLPFFTTKEVDRGTGLGLAVVYGIVQEHGARISFSSHEGEGTTFTIEFSLAEDKGSQGNG